MTEQRAFPRIDVADGRIRVTQFGAPHDVHLIDISAGGFQLRGPTPFERHSKHSFVFQSADRDFRVTLDARAAYSRPVTPGPVSVDYVSGFLFVSAWHPNIFEQIEALLAHARATAGGAR